ncbi:hypothetical protein [Streptomyces sp. NPDC058252]|uniref:hypothetical protein n=1 Tax=Streptomyces sp. NPDC058252 TaxID=3346405 RepID=UPI0036E73566
MTISSKPAGLACRSSAPTVTVRTWAAPAAVALARTTSVISGSASTAQYVREPATQREGELAGAAGQVEQASVP